MTSTDKSSADKGGSATDKIVQTAKDLGLPPQAEDIIRSADKAISEAVHKAAALADENREKFAGLVDKAADFVDEKTEGKYHDKVAKAKDAANSAFAKFAEHGADHSGDTTTPGDTAAAGDTPTGDTAAAGDAPTGDAAATPAEDAPTFTAPSSVGEDAPAQRSSTGEADATG